MSASCGTKVVKYVFFAFNFLFFVFGAAIVAISLWIRFDNGFQSRLNKVFEETGGEPIQLHNMYIALYALAAIGALLFVTGFLGCCGACCESVCLLGLFFAVMFFLFVAELVGAIYIIAKRDTIKEEMATWWQKELVERYSKNKAIRDQLDQIHVDMNCCGSRGCSDFALPSPGSCGCNQDPNKQGCAHLIYRTVADNVVIVAIVALVIVAVEMLSMLFACFLCYGIRQSNSFDYY